MCTCHAYIWCVDAHSIMSNGCMLECAVMYIQSSSHMSKALSGSVIDPGPDYGGWRQSSTPL